MIMDCMPPVEHVYQIDENQQLQLLKNHFHSFYNSIVDYHYIPQARYEKTGELERYYSGLPMVNFNAVVGWLKDPEEFDSRINAERQFFGRTPFFWYVDEDADPVFKEALKKHGFIDAGIFRGVIGPLDQTIASTTIPEDCVLEMVKDEKALGEFNDLVCQVFNIGSPTKEAYQKFLWDLMHDKSIPVYHWVVRKQGRVVSAVSTMIKDGVASFWNGASSPDLRKQGLNTALRRFSLQHAIEQGARFGSSYLMSEGLAFGICSKLDYTTKWRFHAFISPKFQG